jgi:hypothetical protein
MKRKRRRRRRRRGGGGGGGGRCSKEFSEIVCICWISKLCSSFREGSSH